MQKDFVNSKLSGNQTQMETSIKRNSVGNKFQIPLDQSQTPKVREKEVFMFYPTCLLSILY